jgi:hypothetical protein
LLSWFCKGNPSNGISGFSKVALVTSLPAVELDATEWLAANRAAWDIENE